MRDVSLDRASAYAELCGDLLVEKTLAKKLDDLELAASERVGTHDFFLSSISARTSRAFSIGTDTTFALTA
jgi:hypothetical protein